MIFEKRLIPFLMLDSFRDVTPDLLSAYDIKFLICDIDNTLVTYDDEKPTDEVMSWFESLESAGIGVAFISNNKKERVDRFNEKLNYLAESEAGKPKKEPILRLIRKSGVPKDRCAVLGDQLLTDAACASGAGIRAIIVPPIKDKTSMFFRFKRLVEKPYIRKYTTLGKTGDM